MTARRIRTPHVLTNTVLPADMANAFILEMDEHYADMVREFKSNVSNQVQVNVLRWQQEQALRRASR